MIELRANAPTTVHLQVHTPNPVCIPKHNTPVYTTTLTCFTPHPHSTGGPLFRISRSLRLRPTAASSPRPPPPSTSSLSKHGLSSSRWIKSKTCLGMTYQHRPLSKSYSSQPLERYLHSLKCVPAFIFIWWHALKSTQTSCSCNVKDIYRSLNISWGT
jgi:hypothetical protein